VQPGNCSAADGSGVYGEAGVLGRGGAAVPAEGGEVGARRSPPSAEQGRARRGPVSPGGAVGAAAAARPL